MGEGFTWETQDRARDIAAAQAEGGGCCRSDDAGSTGDAMAHPSECRQGLGGAGHGAIVNAGVVGHGTTTSRRAPSTPGTVKA